MQINIFRSKFSRMEKQPTSFQALLGKGLHYIEMVSLLLIGSGFAARQINQVGGMGPALTMIGFTAFAIVCYLYAFLPPAGLAGPVETSGAPERKPGFMKLLPVLGRKVAYIASAVCLLGILFAIRHLAGAGQMLLIGVISVTIASLICIFNVITDSESLNSYKGVLLRAMPIAAYSIHWLYQYWPLQM